MQYWCSNKESTWCYSMNRDSAILAQSLLVAHREFLYKAPYKASLYKVPNKSKKAMKEI